MLIRLSKVPMKPANNQTLDRQIFIVLFPIDGFKDSKKNRKNCSLHLFKNSYSVSVIAHAKNHYVKIFIDVFKFSAIEKSIFTNQKVSTVPISVPYPIPGLASTPNGSPTISIKHLQSIFKVRSHIPMAVLLASFWKWCDL